MTWLILFGLPTLAALVAGATVYLTLDPWEGPILPAAAAAWLIAFVVVGIVLLIRAGIRTAF